VAVSFKGRRTETPSFDHKVEPGASRTRGKMTWAEIRQLRAELKAKAGKQAALTAIGSDATCRSQSYSRSQRAAKKAASSENGICQ